MPQILELCLGEKHNVEGELQVLSVPTNLEKDIQTAQLVIDGAEMQDKKMQMVTARGRKKIWELLWAKGSVTFPAKGYLTLLYTSGMNDGAWCLNNYEIEITDPEIPPAETCCSIA